MIEHPIPPTFPTNRDHPYVINISYDLLKDSIALSLSFEPNNEYGDIAIIEWNLLEKIGKTSESRKVEDSVINLHLPLHQSDWLLEVVFKATYTNREKITCQFCIEKVNTGGESFCIQPCGNRKDAYYDSENPTKRSIITQIIPAPPTALSHSDEEEEE